MLVIAVAALACLVVLAIVALFPVRRLPFGVRRKLVRLREAGREILQQPRTMLRALTMSLSVQLAFITLNVMLAVACGLELPYRVWLFAWPLAKLSAAVPITQAGIGVREAAVNGGASAAVWRAARTVGRDGSGVGRGSGGWRDRGRTVCTCSAK